MIVAVCFRGRNHTADGAHANARHVLPANVDRLRERYRQLHAPDHVTSEAGRIGTRRDRADIQQVLQARRDQ